MCGIAGANNFEKAYNLYKLNLPRGSYSSGLMALDTRTGNCFIHKQKNAFTDKASLLWKIAQSYKDFNYFLFHSRAPTNSTETEWSVETTHPFQQDNCYVAHNGIITNFADLNKDQLFKVDSQIIPHDILKSYSLEKTYSRYEGLLTSWVVLGDTVYVVKAGSSLWLDKDSFSSTEFENSKCVNEDGVIFKLTDNELTLTNKFNYTNPYFI
jgi:glucosamine 6-phosphate synthetase-like amidotransferase/phosphosugar isomerase protein